MITPKEAFVKAAAEREAKLNEEIQALEKKIDQQLMQGVARWAKDMSVTVESRYAVDMPGNSAVREKFKELIAQYEDSGWRITQKERLFIFEVPQIFEGQEEREEARETWTGH